ncbi:hypothetical protein KQX54_010275 [Cotesia glomerata]|uniref:Uncharacterized protein n=1 Tax=Cotesia glomerata TaxID=32391 RepID=A0AAV7IY54_COTGL|nr:hypothetical protein KQX54_010275 [Cotesia glomerata]
MSIIQDSAPTNQMDELAFKLQLLFYYSKLLMKSLDEQSQLLHEIEVQKSELEELEAIAEAQKDINNADN